MRPMRTFALALFALLLAAPGCSPRNEESTPAPAPSEQTPPAPPAAPTEPQAQPGHAMAIIQPTSQGTASGQAHFTQVADGVEMKVTMQGLTPGEHAIHVHANADCGNAGENAGPHWNPTGEEHGKWGSSPYHRGDIGNLVADAQGNATLTFTSNVWSIGGTPDTDVVGRTVIVHASSDDFKTQPTGNAGGRIACGVVQSGGAVATETELK